MIAGPGNEKAAALVGCGHLRASHADRERVVDTLKTAFVQGRLGWAVTAGLSQWRS